MPRPHLPNCLQCGAELFPDKHTGRGIKRFCSSRCGTVWRNKNDPSLDEVRKRASKAAGKVHAAKARKLHPTTKSRVKLKRNGKRILRYRYLMEKELGRELLRSEIVHHVNEDKQDDRLENLELLSSQSEHARLHALKRKGVK